MSAHTPTPWRAFSVETVLRGKCDFVRGTTTQGFPCVVADCGLNNESPPTRKECRANAELIVCAVNSHAELLAALINALPYVEDILSNPEQLACFKQGVVKQHALQIRDAIARASR
jgi:hypothetical protein